MNWLVQDIVSSIFIDTGKNQFSKVYRKIKYKNLKKSLTVNLRKQILDKFQKEIFYNPLDSFLCEQNIFRQLISNCDKAKLYEYKSLNQFTQYYTQLFIETKPEFQYYASDIKNVISMCFKTIFETLNDYQDDEIARKIINNNKELFSELYAQVEENKDIILQIGEKIDNLKLTTSDNIIKSITKESLQKYFENLEKIYNGNKVHCAYIQRNIFSNDKKEDSLTALLKAKQILLLGEAGSGKSIESINLLEKLCTDGRTSSIIPIFISLQEYGRIFDSILDAIRKRLSIYCETINLESINYLLNNASVALILDGIDDVQDDIQRNKCILEIRNIISYYSRTMVFITSRINRYHGELGNINTYNLKGIEREDIRRKLLQEQIYIDIPDSYYDLFSNPLFLEIGIKVLKRVKNREIFNRSVLFEELMVMCCGEWDIKKGLSITRNLSYSEIFYILGKFAFETFNKPCYRLLEFDSYITDNIRANDMKLYAITTLLNTGLFVVSDTISFSHKLFKEYFAAYYLIRQFPSSENNDLYNRLASNDLWQEVLIFSVGMFNTIADQDTFLDFILHTNFKLYIECVNSKSDLSSSISALPKSDYINRYLELLVDTYTYIIQKNFNPIKNVFDPTIGVRENNPKEKTIRIVGNISEDGLRLHYWFDRVDIGEPNVLYLEDNQLAEYHKQFEHKAIIEGRNIRSHSINLSLSNLLGDSARKVALNKVKSELKDIIEKRMLIESDYLLCERVEAAKKKLNIIKNCKNLKQMYEIISEEVASIYAKSGVSDFVSINSNGIDLIPFSKLLYIMIEKNINYEVCLLPGEDIQPTGESCWIWDMYSDTQKRARLSKYFYFHQLSYFEMINNNFPLLAGYFPKYQDTPFQNIILIGSKNSSDGFDGDMPILYYHIASDTSSPKEPKIIDKINFPFNDQNSVYEEIRISYLKQNKIAHELSVTQSVFSSTITSRRTGAPFPLSDYVYESIKKDIEWLLGKF